jgi:choline dehydrogenase-like flavoprotein
MIAKLKICLLDDWRCVLRRAWSIRFSLLAAAFTAAEVVVPLFGDVLLDLMPRGAFVLLAFAASIGATVARIVAQPELHR